jgi:hypothetical protein
MLKGTKAQFSLLIVVLLLGLEEKEHISKMQSVQAPEDEEQSPFWLATVAAARIFVTTRHTGWAHCQLRTRLLADVSSLGSSVIWCRRLH